MTPFVPRLVFAGWLLSTSAAFAAVHQGNGIKIGEVSADSAVIWTRLTTTPEANWKGVPFIEPSLAGKRDGFRTATDVARASGMSEALAKAEKEAKKDPTAVTQSQIRDIVLKADWRSQIPAGRTLAEMHGTLPGANGTVRVSLTPSGDGAPVETTWTIVDPRQDYTRQFKMTSLKPGTTYQVRVESRDDQASCRRWRGDARGDARFQRENADARGAVRLEGGAGVPARLF